MPDTTTPPIVSTYGRPQPMSDTDLVSFIRREFDRSQGGTWPGRTGDQLSGERQKNMRYYLGNPIGNEVEGRSQIVTRDCYEAVETALPDLIESLFTSDYVGAFEPNGPGDEERAKQATEGVHHVVMNDNPGFMLTYNFGKDGLISKNGFLKVLWEVEEKQKQVRMSGLSDDQLTQALAELQMKADSVEIEEQETDRFGLHTVSIRVVAEQKRCKIYACPPEEVLVSDRSNNTEYPYFISHVVRKTRYELIEEGYDYDLVMSLQVHESPEWGGERNTRFQKLTNWRDNRSTDPLNDKLWLYESYCWIDFDGDGRAEYRQVVTLGPSHTLVSNEPFGYQPFVFWSPLPIPHVFFGQALVDPLRDVQEMHTTITRQWLDNMYNINNCRTVINERIELDDMLSNRVGNTVVAEGNEPVDGTFRELTTQSLAPYVAPLLEYIEDRKEARTGLTRENAGLDPQTLNKAASGIAMVMAAGQARQQLMKRIFVETGITALFKTVLKVLVANQDKPRMIRIRGEWVEMDPRYWDADMDFKAHIGLGYGTQQQRIGKAREKVGLTREIIEMQGGKPSGPFVYLEHAYNVIEEYYQELGEKTPERFIANVPDMERQRQAEAMQPDTPNPLEVAAMAEARKAEAQAAKAGADAQLAQQKLRTDAMGKVGDLQLKKLDSDRGYQIDLAKVLMEEQRLQGEQIQRLSEMLDKVLQPTGAVQ